jgi:hypothetical protein
MQIAGPLQGALCLLSGADVNSMKSHDEYVKEYDTG